MTTKRYLPDLSHLRRLTPGLLAAVTTLCAFSVFGAVSLERTIRAEQGKAGFGVISAMLVGKEGVLVTIDSEKGVLTEFKGQAGAGYALSGSGKVFSSDKVSGIARLDEDRYLLANAGDSAVVVVGADGKLVSKLVSEGSDEGGLRDPGGIAWSANRRLYVADSGNDRISVFGLDGVFIRSIGHSGVDKAARLREPVQVAVDAGERVFVLETRDDGIVSVYDSDGKLLKRYTAEAIKKMAGSSPEIEAMAIDDTGLIYLGDNDNGRIYVIDWEQDSMVSSFGSKGEQRGQFRKITSLLAMPGGRLAVADSGNKKIEIYRLPDSGRSAISQLRLPTVGYERDIALKCDAAYRIRGGNVLCLDDDDNKVGTFTSSGRPVVAFRGEFSRPLAASVVDQDVVILDGEKIKIYRLDGMLRYQAGASGDADGQLDSPRGIYLRKDKIYVADTGNRRIQIFSADGIFLDKVTNPESGDRIFSEPTRVVVDPNDNMFVLDSGSAQVLVFSPQHKLMYRISGVESGTRFEKIRDISVDSDGNLYLLAATPENRASILVYNGPTRVVSFGAASKQRSGMQEPVTLSVAPANKTVVSVFDKDKKGMLNYKYMQLPAKLGGLEVRGSIEQATLQWQKAPGSYISRYKVYGARDKQGPYKFLIDVGDTKAVIKHGDAFSNHFYRVSAVSGFSVEGENSNSREDVFQTGYAYYRKMKYQQAADVFRTSYEQDHNDGEVLKYLGLASMEIDKVQDAVAYFRELAQLPGFEAEGRNLQIKALVGVGDYVAAKAVIDRLIAQNTASVDTIVYCGELSLMLGDAIGAVTCLEQALAQDANNIKAHFLIGRAYVKLGIIDKGLAEFDTAVSIDPENAEVWYQGGIVFQDLGKHEEAVKRLDKALALDSGHTRARLALARNHLALKHYDQVRNIAIALAGHKDTEAEGQYLLGLVALANDQNGQALLALTKSTRADASNAAAWLALADTYIKMGQNDKVRAALASAVEGDKTSFDAAWRLGALDYEAGQYETAAESLAIAVALQPDQYDARYKLADAQYRSGAYKQAAANAAEAAKLKPDSIWPNVLLANISNKQGKTGKAIDYIKQAMQKEKNSAELYTRLGGLYVDNSMFDLARGTLEKATLLDATSAAPYVLLGAMYTSRRLYDEAITALDKAVSLDPSPDNKLALDTAYAEKKKSMEFKSNAPQIVLKDLRLERVFSAAYKQYADKPVGRVRLQNASAQDYGDLKLTFTIKGYMDFPATTAVPRLKAGDTLEFPLNASFNNRILEIDEDTGVQAEVAVNFIRDGRNDVISVTQPMTIYGKNAIVWGQPNMVGSFVTPKDDTLRDFVRTAINENRPKADAIEKNLLTAMTLFDVFTADGIKYVADPNSPYSSVTENSVDYVQFGRETLKIKSGDCDDLSVLISASLENLGIETAILDVPGHLLMMFNTGVPESERDLISLDDDLMVVRDGNIWIPVEATMIGTSFAEAWAEGAHKYQEYAGKRQLSVIPLQQAWAEFKPVTLKPAGYTLQVPDTARVSPLVQREKNLLLEKSLERLVRPYRAMAEMSPDNVKARMQVAIIYAKYGLADAAEREFGAILELDPDNSAVQNNRGNVYFNRGDFERALESYGYAEKLASNDAGIKMNMSMAYYKQGNLQLASAKYDEAAMIDDGVKDKYAGFVKLLSK